MIFEGVAYFSWHELKGDSRDPQQWDPLMGSFPYYSHTTPIRIPKDMGMVWEASHKGVPLLGVPEKFPYEPEDYFGRRKTSHDIPTFRGWQLIMVDTELNEGAKNVEHGASGFTKMSLRGIQHQQGRF